MHLYITTPTLLQGLALYCVVIVRVLGGGGGGGGGRDFNIACMLNLIIMCQC